MMTNTNSSREGNEDVYSLYYNKENQTKRNQEEGWN